MTYARQYYRKHKGRIRLYKQWYRAAYPDYERDYARKRKRKKLGIPLNAPHQNRKLTFRQAEEIRQLLAAGIQGTTIAAWYGVRKMTIYQIKGGRTYTKPLPGWDNEQDAAEDMDSIDVAAIVARFQPVQDTSKKKSEAERLDYNAEMKAYQRQQRLQQYQEELIKLSKQLRRAEAEIRRLQRKIAHRRQRLKDGWPGER